MKDDFADLKNQLDNNCIGFYADDIQRLLAAIDERDKEIERLRAAINSVCANASGGYECGRCPGCEAVNR